MLDQILHDESALDALRFVYCELDEAARQGLVRAVLEDAEDPTRALAALLAVEESPTLQRRLAALIGQHGRVERAAEIEGTEETGRARLIHALPGLEAESLHLEWNDHEIQMIEVESRVELNSTDAGRAVSLDEAAEWLAPLLWRHIRSGGALPPGADRFAPFFSPSRST